MGKWCFELCNVRLPGRVLISWIAWCGSCALRAIYPHMTEFSCFIIGYLDRKEDLGIRSIILAFHMLPSPNNSRPAGFTARNFVVLIISHKL